LKPQWIATLRPRLGAVFDRTLVYATGGLAVVGAQYTEIYADNFPQTANLSTTTSKVGWVAGAGVEYSLTNAWSIKAEYLYAQFDDKMNVSGPLIGAGSTNIFSGTADLTSSTVRAGVNYHF